MKGMTVAAVGLRNVETIVRKMVGLPLRPYKVLLEVTSECNSRCVSCAIWKTPAAQKRQDIDLTHIERLFCASGRDIVWLALSGGEVTGYDDFPGVIDLARRHCPNLRLVTFTTNGLRPQKALEWATLVRRAGFDGFITVSLDGDERTHDKLRGVMGNYALCMETMRLLRENGISAHFGITVSHLNERFIASDYAARRDELKAVTFMHSGGIYAQKNSPEDDSILRSLRTIYRSYRTRNSGDFLEKVYLRLGIAFLERRRSTNVIPCAVGHTSLHIAPDGNVRHCMFLGPIGSVKESGSLRDMVNSARSKEMIGKVAEDRCPHCWMNCYAPHSILFSPIRAAYAFVRTRSIGEGARSAEAPSASAQDTAEVRQRRAAGLRSARRRWLPLADASFTSTEPGGTLADRLK
jgi:MoaA/NifB/PqqE/SkfB family radical SAM enzyme